MVRENIAEQKIQVSVDQRVATLSFDSVIFSLLEWLGARSRQESQAL